MKNYGIYGYEISRPAEFDGFRLIPLTDDYTDVRGKASDLDNYHLTGFLEIDETQTPDIRALIFDIQGVLSFIDQKNVIVSNLLREHEAFDNLDEDYPTKLTALKRINGGGKVILGDAFNSNSRREFITMALAKLKESDTENGRYKRTNNTPTFSPCSTKVSTVSLTGPSPEPIMIITFKDASGSKLFQTLP